MKSLSITGLTLLFILFSHFLKAQEVIGDLELKDFPTESPYIYPYEYVNYQSEHIYLAHIPALRINRGEFVHLWKSEKGNYRKRKLTKYNLFMEILWETEFKLDQEEDIFHFFRHKDQLIVLTREYVFPSRTHWIKARVFSTEDGEQIKSLLLWNQEEKRENYIHFETSPDSSKLMLFQFRNENPRRRVRISSDHILRNEKEGYRHYNATEIRYITFNNDLSPADSGRVKIPNRKLISLHFQMDNQGNMYHTVLQKPKTLKVYQVKNGEQKMLEYEDFAELKDIKEPYTTHLPPTVSDQERLYIAISDRVLRGKKKGTKAYQVINFDFAKDEVDLSRKIEINSTLLVNAEKQRESFGLRPLKRFDEYMLREIIEMDDKSLWLITQKYQGIDYHSTGREQTVRTIFEQVMEELILYEFDSTGALTKVIFVPSSQKNEILPEQLSQFYSLNVDKAKRTENYYPRAF
ncbi:MAG: hypothetical protein R3B93_13050 [Bacteroidia bacterium]